jgi:hypothetical protein
MAAVAAAAWWAADDDDDDRRPCCRRGDAWSVSRCRSRFIVEGLLLLYAYMGKMMSAVRYR